MDLTGITWLMISSQIALFLSVIAIVAFTIWIVRQKQSSQFLNDLIGFLTAWTTIYLVVALVALVAWLTNYGFGRFAPDQTADDSTLVFYYLLVLLGKFTSLLTYSLMAYYFFHAKRTMSLSKRDRIYYQIGFLLLPFIAMPLYYLKIIKGEMLKSSET